VSANEVQVCLLAEDLVLLTLAWTEMEKDVLVLLANAIGGRFRKPQVLDEALLAS
jgi:hypothetical protein